MGPGERTTQARMSSSLVRTCLRRGMAACVTCQPVAVRLIFAYEGGDLRLVSRQRVDMVTPPTDAPAAPAVMGGVWAELRDVRGQVLERRVVPDFQRGNVEVFGPEPTSSVSRAPVERPSGAFAVLLPEVAGADHVALLAAPEPTGLTTAAGEARELLRVDLAGS